jgi:parallel beta-helix repeat protein
MQSASRLDPLSVFSRNPGKSLLVGTVCSCLLASSTAAARTWRVAEDGSGDAPFIQAAIESAAVGDEILVGPGTYLENIDFLGKSVILRAEMGFAATTLDGSLHDSSTVVMRRGEPTGTVLQGFTVTGGRGSKTIGFERVGGGLWLTGSPTIRNNRFYKNNAEGGGGALISQGGDPIVQGNLFEENRGGGIWIIGASNSNILDNKFSGNSNDIEGAGLLIIMSQGQVAVEGNEFEGNASGSLSSALWANDPTGNGLGAVLLERNLFVGNINCNSTSVFITHMSGHVIQNTFVLTKCATDLSCYPGGACAGGTLSLAQVSDGFEVSNNIFSGNSGVGVSCYLAQPTSGTNVFWKNNSGNFGSACQPSLESNAIVADPLFCDPENGDFHLAANSPAIVNGVVMGNYLEPGCGPASAEPLTWGRLKALYR